MTRPAIQLHTLRNVDRPLGDLLAVVADAGFEGVEFAGRAAETDPDAVAAALDRTGLTPVAAHVAIDDLESQFEATVDRAERLGVADVVVPHLDAEYFRSREGIGAAADRLTAVESRLDDRGIGLHYHNHDHEFATLDGAPAFDAFCAATTCGIELDLGWALSAGDDPAARLRSLGPRARLVHCKDADVAGDRSVPLGEGDLDLAAVGEAVAAVDPEWLVYEYEGPDPLATLAQSAERTRTLCRSG